MPDLLADQLQQIDAHLATNKKKRQDDHLALVAPAVLAVPPAPAIPAIPAGPLAAAPAAMKELARLYLEERNTLQTALEKVLYSGAYLSAKELVITPTAYSDEERRERIENLREHLNDVYNDLIKKQTEQEENLKRLIQTAVGDKAQLQEILTRLHAIHQDEQHGLKTKLDDLPEAFKQQADLTRNAPKTESIRERFFVVDAANTHIELADPAYSPSLSKSSNPIIRASLSGSQFTDRAIPKIQALTGYADERVFYKKSPEIIEVLNAPAPAAGAAAPLVPVATAPYKITFKDNYLTIELQNLPTSPFFRDYRITQRLKSALTDAYQIMSTWPEAEREKLNISFEAWHLDKSTQADLKKHWEGLSKKYLIKTTGVNITEKDKKIHREETVKEGRWASTAFTKEKELTGNNAIIGNKMKAVKAQFIQLRKELETDIVKHAGDWLSDTDRDALNKSIEKLNSSLGSQSIDLFDSNRSVTFNELYDRLVGIEDKLDNAALFPESDLGELSKDDLVIRRMRIVGIFTNQVDAVLHGRSAITITNPSAASLGEQRPHLETLEPDDQIIALQARKHDATLLQSDIGGLITEAKTQCTTAKDKAAEVNLYKLLQNTAIIAADVANVRQKDAQDSLNKVLAIVLKGGNQAGIDLSRQFIADWQSDIRFAALLNQVYSFLLKNENDNLRKQLIHGQPALQQQLIGYAARQPEKYKDMSAEIKQSIREYVKDKAVLRHQLLAQPAGTLVEPVDDVADTQERANLIKAAVLAMPAVPLAPTSEEKYELIKNELLHIQDPAKYRAVVAAVHALNREIRLDGHQYNALHTLGADNADINTIAALAAGPDRVMGPNGFWTLYVRDGDAARRQQMELRFHQIEWTEDELALLAVQLNLDEPTRHSILQHATPYQAAVLIAQGQGGAWRGGGERDRDLFNAANEDLYRHAEILVEMWQYYRESTKAGVAVTDVCASFLNNANFKYFTSGWIDALLQHPTADPVLLAGIMHRYIGLALADRRSGGEIQTQVLAMLNLIAIDPANTQQAGRKAAVFVHLTHFALQKALTALLVANEDKHLLNAILVFPKDKIDITHPAENRYSEHCEICIRILYGQVVKNNPAVDIAIGAGQKLLAAKLVQEFKDRITKDKWVDVYLATVKRVQVAPASDSKEVFKTIIADPEFMQTIFEKDNTLFEKLLNLPAADVDANLKVEILMNMKLSAAPGSVEGAIERSQLLCEQIAKMKNESDDEKIDKGTLINTILALPDMAPGTELRKQFLQKLSNEYGDHVFHIVNFFDYRPILHSEDVNKALKIRIICGIEESVSRNDKIYSVIKKVALVNANQEVKNFAQHLLVALSGEQRKLYFKDLLGLNISDIKPSATAFWSAPDLMKFGDAWDLASRGDRLYPDDIAVNRAKIFTALVETADLNNEEQLNYLVNLYFHLDEDTRASLMQAGSLLLSTAEDQWIRFRTAILAHQCIVQMQESGAADPDTTRHAMPASSGLLRALRAAPDSVSIIGGGRIPAVTENNLRDAHIAAKAQLIQQLAETDVGSAIQQLDKIEANKASVIAHILIDQDHVTFPNLNTLQEEIAALLQTRILSRRSGHFFGTKGVDLRKTLRNEVLNELYKNGSAEAIAACADIIQAAPGDDKAKASIGAEIFVMLVTGEHKSPEKSHQLWQRLELDQPPLSDAEVELAAEIIVQVYKKTDINLFDTVYHDIAGDSPYVDPDYQGRAPRNPELQDKLEARGFDANANPNPPMNSIEKNSPIDFRGFSL